MPIMLRDIWNIENTGEYKIRPFKRKPSAARSLAALPKSGEGGRNTGLIETTFTAS